MIKMVFFITLLSIFTISCASTKNNMIKYRSFEKKIYKIYKNGVLYGESKQSEMILTNSDRSLVIEDSYFTRKDNKDSRFFNITTDQNGVFISGSYKNIKGDTSLSLYNKDKIIEFSFRKNSKYHNGTIKKGDEKIYFSILDPFLLNNIERKVGKTLKVLSIDFNKIAIIREKVVVKKVDEKYFIVDVEQKNCKKEIYIDKKKVDNKPFYRKFSVKVDKNSGEVIEWRDKNLVFEYKE